MSKCVLLVLVLLYLHASPHSSSGDPVGIKCETETGAPTCTCKNSRGVMNLTKLANYNHTARFTRLADTSGFVYDYNPCAPFSNLETVCTNVQICQTDTLRNHTYAIANYGSEQIWIGEDTQPYVYYSGPGPREVFVSLRCDPSAKEPIVTTTGDKNRLMIYEFILISEYACFSNKSNTLSRCASVAGRPSCVCDHPDGIIDLTKLANFDGSPRFTGLTDPDGNSYDFNFCAPFKAQAGCDNVHMCQNVSCNEHGYIHIADYGTEEIRVGDDGNAYLHYSGYNNRQVLVQLICDYSAEEPMVTAIGDPDRNHIYEFKMTSCHACPGGCI